VWELDLHSYGSIVTFAERAKALERLDIVILNTAVSKPDYDVIPVTGHKETIQVNLLSIGLLAILLLPILKAKKQLKQPGCLVWVQSDTTSWAKFKERNTIPLLPALNDPKNMDRVNRYFPSKLLAQLFVTELTKRAPSPVTIITMPNPGWVCGTGLGRIPGG
jgi:NAD(P)-dependent dehydrogenase (short-subunit alcohol dehydrogenase family)